MLHSLYRFTMAAASYVQILAVFALMGFILWLVSGSVEAIFALAVWGGVFFAPAAYVNTWQDIGD